MLASFHVGRSKCPPCGHRGATIGISRPSITLQSRGQIFEARGRFHCVPLAICTSFHFPLPDPAAQHRGQSTHQEGFPLYGPHVASKTPLDAAFFNPLYAREGRPRPALCHGPLKGQSSQGTPLRTISPFRPLGGASCHVVVDVKTRHIPCGAVLQVQIDESTLPMGTHPVLKVPLIVGRGHLQRGVCIRHQRVFASLAYHRERDQAPSAVSMGTPTSHLQVTKCTAGDLRDGPPTRGLHGDFGVSRPSSIDGAPLRCELAMSLQGVGAKSRRSGHEVHHTTQGIAAVQHTAWTHQHVGADDRKWVDASCILDVARPVNGVVHADPIDHEKDPVGLKTSENRADAALLAHLKMDLTRTLQQVACGLCGPHWRPHRHPSQVGPRHGGRGARRHGTRLHHNLFNGERGGQQIHGPSRRASRHPPLVVVAQRLDPQCVRGRPRLQLSNPKSIGGDSRSRRDICDGGKWHWDTIGQDFHRPVFLGQHKGRCSIARHPHPQKDEAT